MEENIKQTPPLPPATAMDNLPKSAYPPPRFLSKKLTLIFLGLALLIFILGVGAFVLNKSQKPPAAQNAVINSPSPATYETTSLKTYVNTKYGFSFDYPSNLKISPPDPNDYEFAADRVDMQIPEKTRDISIVNGDGKTVIGIVLLPNANRTIEEIKQNPLQGDNSMIKNMRDTTLGDEPAIQYDLSGDASIHLVHNNVEYLIAIVDPKIATQILSTFKFTNQNSVDTSTWKTYTNTLARYEIKYPPNWEVKYSPYPDGVEVDRLTLRNPETNYFVTLDLNPQGIQCHLGDDACGKFITHTTSTGAIEYESEERDSIFPNYIDYAFRLKPPMGSKFKEYYIAVGSNAKIISEDNTKIAILNTLKSTN